MEKFECKDLIKSSTKYFYKYNIKNKVWSNYMKDESIPIEIRNLINGVRYIYANEINNKLENCCLFNNNEISVYPTGSKKLWKIKSIEKTLDINYYPPALLNISDKKLNIHYILVSKNKNKNNMYDTIWIPQLKNKTLYKNFYNKEISLLEDYENKYNNHNTHIFYSKYEKKTINCLNKLINNQLIYKKNNYEDDQEINNNIHCLVKNFHIGPEMYFTYSSVLLIVWLSQLNHKIPINIIKKLAPIAIKEHKILYKITKKDKYLNRINFLNEFIEK
jgi:hypothetical protein